MIFRLAIDYNEFYFYFVAGFLGSNPYPSAILNTRKAVDYQRLFLYLAFEGLSIRIDSDNVSAFDISRAPNNVYFTRICLAKSLRDKGFPFDVKVSQLTRDRAEAVIRNIDVAGALKKIIKSIDHQIRINDFIRYVDEVINHLRTQAYCCSNRRSR
ncbi:MULTISPECIES: hypothetical protein [Pseudomonadati]|uniref:Uncharacterized protein n=1 Tax=Shewanella aestuarii TaxID=1028752 RepID=A0ABT0KX39_9GAMM|nr:hypothetical protein [Shewanella aestuarii]MCL1115939.1 hypothetical protein [Shewanella aestuarii]